MRIGLPFSAAAVAQAMHGSHDRSGGGSAARPYPRSPERLQQRLRWRPSDAASEWYAAARKCSLQCGFPASTLRRHTGMLHVSFCRSVSIEPPCRPGRHTSQWRSRQAASLHCIGPAGRNRAGREAAHGGLARMSWKENRAAPRNLFPPRAAASIASWERACSRPPPALVGWG